MLLNRQAIKTATDFVADAAYAAAAQKVMNATVLLRGGGSGGFFIGSGVILGVGKEVSFANQKWTPTAKQFTVIVSALHNLYMNADKVRMIPPLNGSAVTWDQGMATTFASGVVIDYGPAPLKWKGDPSGKAKIDQVVPIFPQNIGVDGKIVSIAADASSDNKAFQLLNLTGMTNANGTRSGSTDDGRTPVAGTEAGSWDYDVVLLLSKDPSLYTYATSGVCDFMGTKTLAELSAELLPSWSVGGNKFKVPVLDRNYRLLQLGYGDVSDSKVKMRDGTTEKRPEQDPPLAQNQPGVSAPMYMRLQYKRVLPLAATDAESIYLNTEYKLPNGTQLVLRNQAGMLLDCLAGNNSTFSGDSGGPMFAFPKDGGAEAYLVGINSGAGMALSEDKARQALSKDKGVWEYDNNVATSLGLVYAKLPDLRFQNV